MKVIIEIEPELFNNVVKRTQEGDYMSDVWLAVGHGTPYEERSVEPKKEIVPVCTVTFDKEQLQEIVDKKVAELLSDNKRPQGNLADEVWKLYEKYHSHLATSVIEFGDKLKELLGKYKNGGAE